MSDKIETIQVVNDRLSNSADMIDDYIKKDKSSFSELKKSVDALNLSCNSMAISRIVSLFSSAISSKVTEQNIAVSNYTKFIRSNVIDGYEAIEKQNIMLAEMFQK